MHILDKSIGSLYSTEVVQVDVNDTIEVTLKAMAQHKVTSVIVCEKSKPVGILTSKDVPGFIKNRVPLSEAVTSVMTTPLVTCHNTISVLDALDLMLEKSIRHIPIVDQKGNLTGIISETDIMNAMTSSDLVHAKTVLEIMTTDFVQLEPSDSFASAMEQFQNHAGCVVISSGLIPQGVITERDLAGIATSNISGDEQVGTQFSRPVVTIPMSASSDEALQVMKRESIHHLLVVNEDGFLKGVVSRASFFHDITRKIIRRLVLTERKLKKISSPKESVKSASVDNFYVEVTENSPLGMVVFYQDKVVYGNHSAMQMLGVSKNKALSGRRIGEFFVNDEYLYLLEKLAEHSDSRKSEKLDMVRADHTTFIADVSCANVEFEGQLSSLIVFKDVSEEELLVTEAKEHLEARIQRVKDKRDQALETAQVGLWSFDVNSGVWHWDSLVCHILNIGEETVPQMDALLNASHPDDREMVRSKFHQALVNGKPFDLAFRVVLEAGAIRYVKLRGKLSLDAYGHAPRVVGIIYDATELKMAENRMKEAQLRNELILETAGEGIFGLDKKGSLSFCNQVAVEILGYDKSDLLGKPMHETVHYAHQDGSVFPVEICPMRQCIDDGETREVCNEVFWKKDGSCIPVEYTCSPVHENGEVSGAVVVFRDIQSRLLAQKRLADSEHRFRILLDSTPDPMFITDKYGKIQLVNERAKATFEYEEAELIGQSIEILVPEQFRKIHAQHSHDYLKSPKPRLPMQASTDLFAQTKSGRVFPVDVSLNPVETDEGLIVISSLRDISQRKAQEEELKSSMGRFVALFEQSSDAHLIYDDHGIIDCNQAAVTMLGAETRERVLGLHPGDFSPELQSDDVDSAKLAAEMLELAQNKGSHRFDWVHQKLNGELFEAEVTLTCVDLSGKPAMLASLRDMTERKKAEDNVRASELRFREMFEYTPVVYQSLDEQGTLVDINAEWSSVLGYEASEVIGCNFEKFVAPGDRERFRVQFFEQESFDFMDNFELTLVRKDETMLTTLLTGKVQDDSEGTPLRIHCIIVDISEIKQAQNEMAKALGKAEEATRTKSDFLANMSHEIRTPMNAILGMSHLALQTKLDRKQFNYIDKVYRSAQSLLGIINDILDFSKIEAGKLEMDHKSFYLEDVFERLESFVALKAHSKKLELLFDIPTNVPAVKGDALRLGQVLINLADNAIKFTDDGEVVVGFEVESETESDIKLHFSIRDTGIGMNKEQQKKLFTAFSQVDTSMTRRFGGTGLGLVISKQLTEIMGGEIWVDSAVGTGSVFHFTVVLEKGDGIPLIESGKLKKFDGWRALVVDDNASARDIHKYMLEALGFRVDQVKSGTETLELIKQACNEEDPYQLVMMDRSMEYMDGIETSKTIERDVSITWQPHILLVSAFNPEDAVREAVDTDIAFFLNKPLKLKTLNTAIERTFHDLELLSHTNHEDEHQTAKVKSNQLLPGLNILLVEDNEINQELVVDILTSEGAHVDVAENGLLALEKLAEKTFDGVLMDCQMPVMNGYEATRAIRKQDKFKYLPILALTANAMVGDKEEAMAAGMNSHIAKPFDIDEMLEEVKRWFLPVAVPEPFHQDHYGHAGVIRELNGIDASAGLRICQGNQELYKRILLKFRNSPLLEQLNMELDVDELAHVAHSLRGVAGNIGALKVASLAKKLEEACSTKLGHEKIALLLEQMRVELKFVLDGLAELQDSITATMVAEQNISLDEVEGLLFELGEMLEDDDTDAVILAQQLEDFPVLHKHKQLLNDMIDSVERYDFDQALQSLRALEQRFKTK